MHINQASLSSPPSNPPLSHMIELCALVFSCTTTPLPRYHSTISEILISLRKTEDSLAMLKRGRKSAAQQTQAANTDEDKIRAQLKLDVTALGAKVR